MNWDFGETRLITTDNASTETHEDWISFLSTILENYDLGYISEDWPNNNDALQHHIADKVLAHIVKEFGDEAYQTGESGY